MRGVRTVAACVLAWATLGLTACTGPTNVLDLEVGDCLRFADFTGREVTTVRTVNCSTPHDAEVFDALEVPDGEFPGASRLRITAEDFCLPALEGYIGVGYDRSELDVYPLMPTEDSWNTLDDRTILCVAVSDRNVTTSFRDWGR